MKTNLYTHPIPGFTSVNAEERKNLGIRAGDTVRVHQKIKEKGKKGERIRIQVFEGLVLATKHGTQPGATFTVRKVSTGVGMERIFPLYSPVIDKIEIVKRSKVRRAKLYHIREKVAREIKRQMRRTSILGSSTVSDAEYQDSLEQERAAAEEAAQQAEQAATEAVADTSQEVTETQDNTESSQEEVRAEESSTEAAAEEPTQEEASQEEEAPQAEEAEEKKES